MNERKKGMELGSLSNETTASTYHYEIIEMSKEHSKVLVPGKDPHSMEYLLIEEQKFATRPQENPMTLYTAHTRFHG